MLGFLCTPFVNRWVLVFCSQEQFSTLEQFQWYNIFNDHFFERDAEARVHNFLLSPPSAADTPTPRSARRSANSTATDRSAASPAPVLLVADVPFGARVELLVRSLRAWAARVAPARLLVLLVLPYFLDRVLARATQRATDPALSLHMLHYRLIELKLRGLYSGISCTAGLSRHCRGKSQTYFEI